MRRVMGASDPRFAGHRQEDAHDLLQVLNAGLSDTVARGLFSFELQVRKGCITHGHVVDTIVAKHGWAARFPRRKFANATSALSTTRAVALELKPGTVNAQCHHPGCICTTATLACSFSTYPQTLVIQIARFEHCRGCSTKRLRPYRRRLGIHTARGTYLPARRFALQRSFAMQANKGAEPVRLARFCCASGRECESWSLRGLCSMQRRMVQAPG